MEAGKSGSGTAAVPPAPENRRKLLRAAIIGLAIVAALVAWLATRDSGDDSSSGSSASEPAAARLVTPSELGDAAATAGHPIYWAGPRSGSELELTELPDGGTQVRYLPEGTEAGGGSVGVTTIGSYPIADPKAALNGFAKRKGSTTLEGQDGRKVVTSTEQPTSVYFVSPDNSVQVEVYDPSPQRALKLALSSQVRPAG